MDVSRTLPARFDSWSEFYLDLKLNKVLHHPQIIYTEQPDFSKTNIMQPVTFSPQKFDVAFIKDQVIEEYLALQAPSSELSEDDCHKLIELVYAARMSEPEPIELVEKLKAVYIGLISMERRFKKRRNMYQRARY
jgi:hypothetical protein